MFIFLIHVFIPPVFMCALRNREIYPPHKAIKSKMSTSFGSSNSDKSIVSGPFHVI